VQFKALRGLQKRSVANSDPRYLESRSSLMESYGAIPHHITKLLDIIDAQARRMPTVQAHFQSRRNRVGMLQQAFVYIHVQKGPQHG